MQRKSTPSPLVPPSTHSPQSVADGTALSIWKGTGSPTAQQLPLFMQRWDSLPAHPLLLSIPTSIMMTHTGSQYSSAHGELSSSISGSTAPLTALSSTLPRSSRNFAALLLEQAVSLCYRNPLLFPYCSERKSTYLMPSGVFSVFFFFFLPYANHQFLQRSESGSQLARCCLQAREQFSWHRLTSNFCGDVNRELPARQMEHEGKNTSSVAIAARYLHTGMEHWVCSMVTGTGGFPSRAGKSWMCALQIPAASSRLSSRRQRAPEAK